MPQMPPTLPTETEISAAFEANGNGTPALGKLDINQKLNMSSNKRVLFKLT